MNIRYAQDYVVGDIFDLGTFEFSIRYAQDYVVGDIFDLGTFELSKCE